MREQSGKPQIGAERENKLNKREQHEGRMRKKQETWEEVSQGGKGSTRVTSCEEPGQNSCRDKRFLSTLKALSNVPKSTDFFIPVLLSSRYGICVSSLLGFRLLPVPVLVQIGEGYDLHLIERISVC